MLRPRFARTVKTAMMATSRYERHVDRLLANIAPDSRALQAIELSARRAIDAHITLWRLVRTEADGLIAARLDRQLVRRRVAIVLSMLAVLAGTGAVTLVSRYEAQRDKVGLVSAELEADKLRAELSRITAERTLRLQEAQFQTVFDNADLGIAIFDQHGRTLQRNAAVEHILGSGMQTVLDSQRPVIVQFASPNHDSLKRDECRTVDDDRSQWLSLTFSGVYDEGFCQMVILLIRDATEEKLLAQQLAYDANHDSLTGIANRAAFELALRKELEPAGPRRRFALMYLDLDEFKSVNDTFGHRAGDHVLIVIAERLRSVANVNDLCARLGGDEFAILLRGVDNSQTIDAIAKRVGAIVGKPIPYGDVELSLTASIGIAIGSPLYRSIDELKQDADIALYAIKQRGRNGYRIFQQDRQTQPAG